MGQLLKMAIVIGVLTLIAIVVITSIPEQLLPIISFLVVVTISSIFYFALCIFWVSRHFRRRTPQVVASTTEAIISAQDQKIDLLPTETTFFKGCRLFSYKELKDATRDFHEENKLGKGGFGVVYKGTLSDGNEVAVKHLSQGSKQGNEEFMNEVATIVAIQHKNLVKLKGCCIQGEERLLVYEYLENKSLDLSLFGTSTMRVLDWKTRYNIALGIARGLEYLHEQSEPRILHRDIKASNILLDKKSQPKISDFGLARFLPNDQSFIETERMAGTLGYLSPEAMEGHINEKVDVFSYGVLLLEIASGMKKNDSRMQIQTHYIVDWAAQLRKEGRPLELVDHKLNGEYGEREAMNVVNIAMLCVNEIASLRPKMSDVVFMLDLSTCKCMTKECVV